LIHATNVCNKIAMSSKWEWVMDLLASEGEVGMLVLAGWCSCSCVAASLSFTSIHPSMAEYDFLFKVLLLGGSGVGSTPIHRVLRLDDWFDARYSLPLLEPHRDCCVAQPGSAGRELASTVRVGARGSCRREAGLCRADPSIHQWQGSTFCSKFCLLEDLVLEVRQFTVS